MAKVTYDIYADGIQQGTINSSGNASSAIRVRSTGRFEVPAMMSKILTVTATCNTGKQLQLDVIGYVNSSTTSYTLDDYWLDISTSTNTLERNYRTNGDVLYLRFLLRYSDNTNITPSEITSFTITVEDIWQADANDRIYSLYNEALPELKAGIYGDSMPFYTWVIRPGESSPVFFTENLLEHDTKFERPYPFSYWRVDDGNSGDTYKDFFMETPRIPHEPPEPVPPAPEYEEAITMQYDIYCDGQLMHSTVTPEKEWKVIDPVLDLQDSAAGSLEFTLPPFNCMYGKCQMMMSTISVRRNGVEIWEGRPVSFKEDMWLNHIITCEGELAYLNDIYQAQHKYENVTLEQLINGLLIEYNRRAAANRQFTLGYCETPDIQSDMIEVIIPFESTLQAINDLCKTYNMHIYMANTWVNDVKTRKINIYSDSGQLLGNNATQKIEIGRNLTDYAKSYNFSSLVTAILPLGAKSSKAGSTQKDDDAEIDILSTSIVKGSIKNDGTNIDDVNNRVRTSFINITSGADEVTINVSGTNIPPGQTLQFALELYSGNTIDTHVLEYKENNNAWFDMPKTINVATYGATHARLVFRFSGDNAILPEYITSGTISVSKTRHGEPYAVSGDSSQRYGRGYVIWPTNGYDKRDEQHRQRHEAGDIVDITDIPDFDTHETGFSRNRYFVYKYTITEKNATVFIDTQMKMGAGIVVVHNNNSKYYIKKSNKNGTTTWDDMKFSGWYEGFTGDVTMYVAGYDTISASGVPNGLTVYNSKVVDSGLEEYVTVQNIGGEGVTENINGLYVIDNTGAAVGQRPIDIYGRIEKKIDWSDVKDSWTLYQNAITYLRSDQFDGLQIDLTAMDMSMLGFNATQLRVGEKVNVVAPIYGLNTEMPVSAIKIPLNKPEEATYTVGSKKKQTLTSVNTSTNSELLSLIAEKPDMSTVLKTAKKSAAEYLLDTQNGYVTMRYGENGHPEAIIISDNEDYTMSSAGYWIFGKHGIGFIKAGDDEDEKYNETTVAMRSDGQIVADYITTGTMSAERIFGDTLKLGVLGTTSGNMEVYTMVENSQHEPVPELIAKIDENGILQQQAPDPDDSTAKYSVIEMHDGRLDFTRANSNAATIFIKGDGILEGMENWATMEIYAGNIDNQGEIEYDNTSVLGLAVGAVAIWIDGEGYGEGKTTVINIRNNRYSFTKGFLTGVYNDGESLPSTTFDTADNKRITVTDGLITNVANIPSNNNNE